MPNTFLDINYYFGFIYFFLVAFFAFYIPGNTILKKIEISFLPKSVYSFGIGIILWSLQGFIFGFIGLRDLSYLYLGFFLILWIYLLNKSRPIKIPEIHISRYDIPVILVLIMGILIQVIFTFFNGVEYEAGLRFCCDLPDNLYHIALTDSLVKNFPPYEPAMFGTIVKNYHYLGNLVSAELIRVFKMPLIYTQYHYMALLVSLLLGLSAISFAKILKLNNTYIFFLLLFLFFAGDITYILSFLQGKGFNFNTPFLYDSTTLWFSPPRVYAIMITFMGLGLFCIWLKKYSLYLTVILSIIFASLMGFKIYSGVSVFVGLIFVSVYFAIKKQYKRLILLLFSLIIGFLIYFPVNDRASGLSYVGFWRVENFVSQPGLGLTDMELARNVYKSFNNTPRVIGYELYYIALYFVFVFGALNIAFIQNKKTLSVFPKEINIFLIPSIFISLILGFFSFQKISGANTSQFLITAEIISSLYAALICAFIFDRFKKIKWIFLIIIIFITMPRVMNKSYKAIDTIINNRSYLIENQELQALMYLKNNSPRESLILSDNENLDASKLCYYIKFLSERNLFLCDQFGILGDHGVDFKEQNADYVKILNDANDSTSHKLIIKNKINFIYLSTKRSKKVVDDNLLKNVFENEEIKIIKVNR